MIELAPADDCIKKFPRADLLSKVVGMLVWFGDYDQAHFSFGYRTALTKRCGLTTRSPLRCISARGAPAFAYFVLIRPAAMTPLEYRTAAVQQAAIMLTGDERLHVSDYAKEPPRSRRAYGARLVVRDFANSADAVEYIEKVRSAHVEFDNLDRARPLKLSSRKKDAPHFPDRWMDYDHSFLKCSRDSFAFCYSALKKELMCHE